MVMMMKQDPTFPTACGKCGVEERGFLLHRVGHRQMFRRLCTSCVLRLHTESFCPTCFVVYEQTPNDVVSCSKCYSHTHPHCLLGSNNPAAAANRYICSSCEDPNSLVFQLKSENSSAIDEKAARLLLAAARIVAESMNTAVEVAVQAAERRASEAALARKRAREALEHLAFLMAKEKLKRREISSIGIVHSDRGRVNSGNGNEVSSGDLGHLELESDNAEGEKVINGPFSGLAVGDQLQQHMQNSLGGEENVGSQ